jgi:hypothetical protein
MAKTPESSPESHDRGEESAVPTPMQRFKALAARVVKVDPKAIREAERKRKKP